MEPAASAKHPFLRRAQLAAHEAGYLTVWTTGRSDVDMAPDLARALAEQIRRDSFAERAKGLLQRLDTVQLEFGVPGAKVGIDATPTRDPADIETSLEAAGRFARENGRGGLAVFVDEFHEAGLADRRSLLIALQHFDGSAEGCPVAVIGAGLPTLLSAVTEAATFGERSKFIAVEPLTDVATAEALRLPAEQLGVSWSDAAIDAAITNAAGYPHRVQLIGEAAWAAARPSVGEQIEVGHVRQSIENVDAQMAGLFRARLAKTSGRQREFLKAMATLGSDVVRRADLAAELNQQTTALSDVRQQLIDRGLIEPAGRGVLRFTIPGFGAYLRELADQETGPSS